MRTTSAAIASSRGSVATSSIPIVLRAVAEIGRASARRTSSSTPASNIALRARLDPPLERRPSARRGRREASDAAARPPRAGRVPARARIPASASSSARTTRRRSFACTSGRRGGVERCEPRVGCVGAFLVVELAPSAPARPAPARGGSDELGQRRPQIQAGAPDDDRCPPGGEDLVDRGVGELLRTPRPRPHVRAARCRRAELDGKSGSSGSADRDRPASRRPTRAPRESVRPPPRRRPSCRSRSGRIWRSPSPDHSRGRAPPAGPEAGRRLSSAAG